MGLFLNLILYVIIIACLLIICIGAYYVIKLLNKQPSPPTSPTVTIAFPTTQFQINSNQETTGCIFNQIYGGFLTLNQCSNTSPSNFWIYNTGTKTLENENTGLCAYVINDSNVAGALIQTGSCSSPSVYAQWELTADGIMNLANNLCLGLPSGGAGIGSNIVLVQCAGNNPSAKFNLLTKS